MELNCPSCGSDNTQKLSLAVAGGTFSSQSVSMGMGLTGTGVGVGGASTKGTSASKFAEKNAEPQKEQPIKMFVAVLILSGFAAIFMGAIAVKVGFWIGVFVAASCIYTNVKRFPREHAEWNSKFLCQRCSMIFIPQASEDKSIIATEERPTLPLEG